MYIAHGIYAHFEMNKSNYKGVAETQLSPYIMWFICTHISIVANAVPSHPSPWCYQLVTTRFVPFIKQVIYWNISVGKVLKMLTTLMSVIMSDIDYTWIINALLNL